MSWIAAGIGAGVVTSLLKNTQDQQNQKAQMQANAAQIKYSPWTHAAVQVQGPSTNSTLGSIASGGMQGGLTGALMGQQLNNPATAGLKTTQGAIVSDTPQTLYNTNSAYV